MAAEVAALTRAVVDSMPQAVLLSDHQGRVVYRNPRGDALFPRLTEVSAVLAASVTNLSNTTWNDCVAQIERGATRVQLDALTFRDPGGMLRTVDLTIRPLRLGRGGKLQGFQIQTDTRAEIGRSSMPIAGEGGRIDGTLVARVAHELNNPLDGIMRFVSLALRLTEGSDQAQMRSYLEPAQQGLKRLAQIIRELLEFSRSGELETESRSINRIVEESLHTLQNKCDQGGVSVVLDLREQGMPQVRGSRFFQVCCNLFKNAIEAMPEGGRLTITCAVMEDQVVLRVEDTGVGLPQDADCVFEPFFTTKQDSDGTGLGLAICKEYVEGLGGRITAERRSQGGSIFIVTAPIARLVPSPSMGVAST